MLLAILNCCTREELEESTDEDSAEDIPADSQVESDRMLRREAIKNKVLAVGRMARVFDLLRCVSLAHCMCITMIDNPVWGNDDREEAEGVSELTLETPREQAQGFRDDTLGTQGHRIKKSIHNFDDAYVAFIYLFIFYGGGGQNPKDVRSDVLVWFGLRCVALQAKV